MATFEKVQRKAGARWRVQVCVNGKRASRICHTKAEAAAWALRQESEMSGRSLPAKTVADGINRYIAEVSPTHGGAEYEIVRFKRLARTWRCAPLLMQTITEADITDWRDARLKQVKPGTVAREMTDLALLFEAARKEWLWVRSNPVRDVSRPKEPPSRKRRVPDDEIAAMLAALGYVEGVAPATKSQEVAVAFLLALETAMRAGEVIGLTWTRVREKAVTLPKTKNGDQRDVPLSPRARELLSFMPRDRESVFSVRPKSRDALFRKARKSVKKPASVQSLHFHDSRSEAIWRLSKKLDVLELARVIGHRDPRSLLLYYNTSADELADKL